MAIFLNTLIIDIAKRLGASTSTVYRVLCDHPDIKNETKEQIKKIKEHGLLNYIRRYSEFQGESKQEFFSNIDIMSVPVRKYDGYGLYILEANAAGIPGRR